MIDAAKFIICVHNEKVLKSNNLKDVLKEYLKNKKYLLGGIDFVN